LLLPGVGAFDNAMARINATDLRAILDQKALKEKIPVLGICLGLQLLTRSSEEGALPGLGWIQATTKRFPQSINLKVPHMGWNTVRPIRSSPLIEGMPEGARFYFVHSYSVHAENPDDSILRTHYGIDFDAAVQRDNIYGAQFHPEKSHKFGMKLLENFARL
jgi:imidazole glycerol-phosphate synthase subunit HisH